VHDPNVEHLPSHSRNWIQLPVPPEKKNLVRLTRNKEIVEKNARKREEQILLVNDNKR
jgi:hypothetical protein